MLSPPRLGKAVLKRLVEGIFEMREYAPCQYQDSGGDTGDCANWKTCPSECPLRQLANLAGIKGRNDGEYRIYSMDVNIKEDITDEEFNDKYGNY
jgi:hypothetical protein